MTPFMTSSLVNQMWCLVSCVPMMELTEITSILCRFNKFVRREPVKYGKILRDQKQDCNVAVGGNGLAR